MNQSDLDRLSDKLGVKLSFRDTPALIQKAIDTQARIDAMPRNRRPINVEITDEQRAESIEKFYSQGNKVD